MVEYKNPKYNAEAAKKVTAPRTPSSSSSSSTSSASSSGGGSSSIGTGSIKVTSSGTYTQTVNGVTTKGVISGSPADLYARTGSSRRMTTTQATPQVVSTAVPIQQARPTPQQRQVEQVSRDFDFFRFQAPQQQDQYTKASFAGNRFANVPTKQLNAGQTTQPSFTSQFVTVGETARQKGISRPSPSTPPQPTQPKPFKDYVSSVAYGTVKAFTSIPPAIVTEITIKKGTSPWIDPFKQPREILTKTGRFLEKEGQTQGQRQLGKGLQRAAPLEPTFKAVTSDKDIITAASASTEAALFIPIGGFGITAAKTFGKVGAKEGAKFVGRTAADITKTVGTGLAAQALTEKTIEKSYTPQEKEAIKSKQFQTAYSEARRKAAEKSLFSKTVLFSELPLVTTVFDKQEYLLSFSQSLKAQGLSQKEIENLLPLAERVLVKKETGELAGVLAAGAVTETIGEKRFANLDKFSTKDIRVSKELAAKNIAKSQAAAKKLESGQIVSPEKLKEIAQRESNLIDFNFAGTQIQKPITKTVAPSQLAKLDVAKDIIKSVEKQAVDLTKQYPTKLRGKQLEMKLFSGIAPLGIAEGVAQQAVSSKARGQELSPTKLLVAGTLGGISAGYLVSKIAANKGLKGKGYAALGYGLDVTEYPSDVISRIATKERNPFPILTVSSTILGVGVSPVPAYTPQTPTFTSSTSTTYNNKVTTFKPSIQVPTLDFGGRQIQKVVETSKPISYPAPRTEVPSKPSDLYKPSDVAAYISPTDVPSDTPTSISPPTYISTPTSTSSSVPSDLPVTSDVPTEVSTSVPTTTSTLTAVPVPVPVLFPKLPEFDPNRKKKKGFAVFVRKKGLFAPSKEIFGTQTEALAFGKFKVGTSAAATFKIKETSLSPTSTYSKPFTLSGLYTKGTGSNKLYIERPSYRIKSTGELREITYKGIATKKFKKTKFL